MCQVTRFMIGHRLFWDCCRGRCHSDFDEPLVNVLHLFVPGLRLIEVTLVSCEQLSVMFKVRPTTAGVRNNSVKLVRWELVDLFSSKPLSKLPFTIMSVQGPAAKLLGRRNH